MISGTRVLVFALAACLTGTMVPAMSGAQQPDEKCRSCDTDRDREARRYQQEIERAMREIASIERQLSERTRLDTATVRRLNAQLERAIAQLSRTQARQAARIEAGSRVRVPSVAMAPMAGAPWLSQRLDGYIGVLWSASVHVERKGEGESLWTFHDYPQVEAVERGSPAERAGIAAGDVIVAFDGKDLRAGRIPMNSVLRPGNTVQVRLTRDRRTRQVSVKVEERPATVARVRTPSPSNVYVPRGDVVVEVLPEIAAREPLAPLPALPAPPGFGGVASAMTVGAEMIVLDETLGDPYGVDYGLLIVRVGPETPAARAGIQKGDVLLSVNGRELRSVPQLIRAVERAEKREVRLEILRKRARREVVMRW